MLIDKDDAFYNNLSVQKKYGLDSYSLLGSIGEGTSAKLIVHNENGSKRVLKQRDSLDRKLYERLQKEKLSEIPKIDLVVSNEDLVWKRIENPHSIMDDESELKISVVTDSEGIGIIENLLIGETLQEKIDRQGHLSEEETLKYFLQLSEILLKFSQLKPRLLHGDINLKNIFICENDVVRVINLKDGELVQTDIRNFGDAMKLALYAREGSEKKINATLNKVINKCLKTGSEQRRAKGYKNIAAVNRDLRKLKYVLGNVEEKVKKSERVKYDAFSGAASGNGKYEKPKYEKPLGSGIRQWSLRRTVVNVIVFFFFTYAGLNIDITYASGDPLPLALSISSKLVTLFFYYSLIVFFNDMWGIKGIFTLKGKVNVIGSGVYVLLSGLITSLLFMLII